MSLRQLRALAAGTLILVPVGIGAMLLFGGGRVNQCLGGNACALPQPQPMPLIGTTDPLVIIAVAMAIAWLGAAAVTIWHLVRTDRHRFLRATAGMTTLVVATAAAVAVWRLTEGQRLRIVAEDAALYGLGALLIGIPLLLAWAVVTERPSSRVVPGD